MPREWIGANFRPDIKVRGDRVIKSKDTKSQREVRKVESVREALSTILEFTSANLLIESADDSLRNVINALGILLDSQLSPEEREEAFSRASLALKTDSAEVFDLLHQIYDELYPQVSQAVKDKVQRPVVPGKGTKRAKTEESAPRNIIYKIKGWSD